LGILGGTFDPVHNAHLAIAKAATDELGLDRILWIPTGKPDYREPPVANVYDRLAMLALAVKDFPDYEIDRRELEANASPYTVDTLKALHAERPQDELYLLLGGDQYASLRRWRQPAEVARLARLAVFTRPRHEVAPGGDAIVVPMAPLAVSASDIRARAARGESLGGLVPAAVANYIAENRLYR
jgi:nicotinate-nucleotide adenylyltransferase